MLLSRAVRDPSRGAAAGGVHGCGASLSADRVGRLAIAGGEATRGWGIAISTDAAFALGVLALVVPRCPNRLRIFLLALAIVEDIAAIGVIAVFYTLPPLAQIPDPD